jgi:hypothetical protein
VTWHVAHMEKAAGFGKGAAAAGTERRHAAIVANLCISGSPNAYPVRESRYHTWTSSR